MRAKYRCAKCKQEFEASDSEGQPCCPRCGGAELEENKFLFGTSEAKGLTFEDYFDTLLAPCCGDARGIAFCQWGPKEEGEEEETDKEGDAT